MLVANDIAPAYAGIVFGISNTFSTISGIVSPYVVGALTGKVSLILLNIHLRWRMIISGSEELAYCIFYLCCYLYCRNDCIHISWFK
jgi:hypothetical protein